MLMAGKEFVHTFLKDLEILWCVKNWFGNLVTTLGTKGEMICSWSLNFNFKPVNICSGPGSSIMSRLQRNYCCEFVRTFECLWRHSGEIMLVLPPTFGNTSFDRVLIGGLMAYHNEDALVGKDTRNPGTNFWRKFECL